MSQPFLDLDEPSGGEPAASFRLAGRDWQVRNADDVPFDFIRKMAGLSEEGDAKALLGQVESFFAAVLVPGDAEAFLELIRGDASPLTLGKLRPLIEFINGELLGAERPTVPPKPSPAGRLTAGRTSAAG